MGCRAVYYIYAATLGGKVVIFAAEGGGFDSVCRGLLVLFCLGVWGRVGVLRVFGLSLLVWIYRFSAEHMGSRRSFDNRIQEPGYCRFCIKRYGIIIDSLVFSEGKYARLQALLFEGDFTSMQLDTCDIEPPKQTIPKLDNRTSTPKNSRTVERGVQRHSHQNTA